MKWTRRKRRGKSTIRVYDGSKLAHSLEPPVIEKNNRLTYLSNLHYPDTEPVADGIYSTHAMLIDDVKL
ncbi:hypothetical protein ACQJBY_032508 [Aegilops geniculata]